MKFKAILKQAVVPHIYGTVSGIDKVLRRIERTTKKSRATGSTFRSLLQVPTGLSRASPEIEEEQGDVPPARRGDERDSPERAGVSSSSPAAASAKVVPESSSSSKGFNLVVRLDAKELLIVHRKHTLGCCFPESGDVEEEDEGDDKHCSIFARLASNEIFNEIISLESMADNVLGFRCRSSDLLSAFDSARTARRTTVKLSKRPSGGVTVLAFQYEYQSKAVSTVNMVRDVSSLPSNANLGSAPKFFLAFDLEVDILTGEQALAVSLPEDIGDMIHVPTPSVRNLRKLLDASLILGMGQIVWSLTQTEEQRLAQGQPLGTVKWSSESTCVDWSSTFDIVGLKVPEGTSFDPRTQSVAKFRTETALLADALQVGIDTPHDIPMAMIAQDRLLLFYFPISDMDESDVICFVPTLPVSLLEEEEDDEPFGCNDASSSNNEEAEAPSSS